MEKTFEQLDWDTEFFGFGVARIIPTDLCENELSKILDELRTQNYRMAYWQVPAENRSADQAAQALGGFRVDEKLTYVKCLSDQSNTLRSSSRYSATPYPESIPDSKMLRLAQLSGKYSRFNRDPEFPNELFEKLYKRWITSSVKKEISWEVLIVEEHGDLLGMLTLGSSKNRNEIGLVAVSEQARGKGVGRALMTAAEELFRENGFTRIQVVTQKQNLGACRLYESCGYNIDHAESTYHFWF